MVIILSFNALANRAGGLIHHAMNDAAAEAPISIYIYIDRVGGWGSSIWGRESYVILLLYI